MIEIELPNGEILEFPEGMSEEDMLNNTQNYWQSIQTTVGQESGFLDSATSVAEDVAYTGQQFGRGLSNLIELPSTISRGAAAGVGSLMDLISGREDAPGFAERFSADSSGIIPDPISTISAIPRLTEQLGVAEPQSNIGRYAGAAAEGVGATLPFGLVGMLAGAGGGLAGEGLADVAQTTLPGNENVELLARVAGDVVGGGVTGLGAGKALGRINPNLQSPISRSEHGTVRRQIKNKEQSDRYADFKREASDLGLTPDTVEYALSEAGEMLRNKLPSYSGQSISEIKQLASSLVDEVDPVLLNRLGGEAARNITDPNNKILAILEQFNTPEGMMNLHTSGRMLREAEPKLAEALASTYLSRNMPATPTVKDVLDNYEVLRRSNLVMFDDNTRQIAGFLRTGDAQNLTVIEKAVERATETFIQKWGKSIAIGGVGSAAGWITSMPEFMGASLALAGLQKLAKNNPNKWSTSLAVMSAALPEMSELINNTTEEVVDDNQS